MNLKIKHARFLWIVGVVLALSLAPGCNDNGPSGKVFTPTLTATFASDGALADNGVGLEFDSYSSADNELTLKVVVQNVGSFYGAAVAVEFNPFILEYLHADLPAASFLAEGGATVLFDKNLYGTALVDIVASRQDAALPGVTMVAGQKEVLATITFKVLKATQVQSPIVFAADVAADLLWVRSCASVGACDLVTADITFVGGTVTVVAN